MAEAEPTVEQGPFGQPWFVQLFPTKFVVTTSERSLDLAKHVIDATLSLDTTRSFPEWKLDVLIGDDRSDEVNEFLFQCGTSTSPVHFRSEDDRGGLAEGDVFVTSIPIGPGSPAAIAMRGTGELRVRKPRARTPQK